MRIGIGHDTHRLIPTIKPASIPIGGVPVNCYYSTQAHSDGDVLLHAIVDACLGALALGDIGSWFPDTASENEGRKSCDFIRAVLSEVRRLGWRVNNVDANIFLEEPKLSSLKQTIRESLAMLLGVELSSVSVKAKTMEGLGPIGERRAISAEAVVTLVEVSRNGVTTH